MGGTHVDDTPVQRRTPRPDLAQREVILRLPAPVLVLDVLVLERLGEHGRR